MRPLRTAFLERAIAAVVSASLIAGCSAAVQPSAPLSPGAPHCVVEGEPPPAISSKPGYTQVQVSVTDSNGKPVRGLKQSEFTIYSGADQYSVVYFHEDGGMSPKSIVIAIDTSRSMERKLETVRREFGKLVKELNPCDQVALFAFSTTPFLLEDLTTNHQAVEDRLGLLHAYGRTALYDAIERSLKTLSTAKYRDRALVLVTDGIDNSTSVTRKSLLLASLAQNNVPIYVIGIGDPDVPAWQSINMGPLAGSASEEPVDKSALDAIASVTGGEDFIVPPMDKDQGQAFAAALATLGDQLHAGYEVGFVAPTPSTTPTIAVPNQADYIVRIMGAPAQPK